MLASCRYEFLRLGEAEVKFRYNLEKLDLRETKLLLVIL